MTADLRFALRLFRKNPMFFAVATGSLAVGVAINVVMFGVVNAVMFRPLPVPDAGGVVDIGATAGGGILALSHPEFSILREALDTFDGVVARRFNQVVVNFGDEPREVAAELVSAGYLSVLDVAPVIGRGPGTQDVKPGAPPVVVISHLLWEQQFQRSPSGSRALAPQGDRDIGRDPRNR